MPTTNWEENLILGVAAILSVTLPAPRGASAGEHLKKQSIATHMNEVKNNLKAAAGKLQNPATADDALENVRMMMKHLMSVSLLDPPGLVEIPEADRAKRRRAFRLSVTRALRELVDMEIDLLEGHIESAFKRMTGPLFKMREAAHNEFKQEK